MFGITINICVIICATLLAAKCVVLGQHHHHKPWPTYSLQNMPQTRFTCHDKILGGYYADAETQCQMFHVCVKVAGGVQDFRFLCPNSTAFDQEAQICADWGDVDCEQSVLYYGSDNFDLYRIGSGFESKRAPLAEEEEATFHLQRAESADTRRSKETRVDQKLRPDQPPNYTKHFAANTRTTQNYANLAAQRNPQKNTYNNYNNDNNNNYNGDHAGKRLPESAPAKQPIVNYYTPTTSTTTTTTTSRRPKTTTSTTERYNNNNDESKQDLDEIFKGSHSSHYFANRNGGREDDFQDHSAKTKPNDFNDYSRKLAETSTNGKTRVQPTRGHSRRNQQQQQSSTPATTVTNKNTTPSTTTSKFSKKFTLQTYYQTSDLSSTQYYKTSTPVPTTTTTASTTARPLSYGNANSNNRFSFNAHDYQTQEKIIPTTYNPANSFYRYKTTTPKSTDVGSIVPESSSLALKPNKHSFYGDQNDNQKKHAAHQSRRKPEKAHIPPQNSTFVNHKEFAEFSKILTPQEPHPFKPAQVFRPPPISKADDKPNPEKSRARANNNEPQYFRSRGQPAKSSGYQEPAPFSAPTLHQRVGNTQHRLQLTSSTSAPPSPSSTAQPRGFTSRGKINYKATTQREDYNDNYTPTSYAPKKFSTLVPKEQQYQPTTFKPTTYKKAYENPYFQQTIRPANKLQKQQTISTTTQLPTTLDPYYNPDEDDGQYHPELYEQDFPKNRLKQQRSTTTTGAPPTITFKSNNNYQYPQSHLKTQQQSFFQKQQQQQAHRQDTGLDSGDLSDEDELFKTAHSLNFGAASVNKLRADILKAEKTSQQYNSQYLVSQQPTSPTTAAPSYLPTTSTTTYSYPTYAPSTTSVGTTSKPFTAFSTTSATTTYTTTTRRPTTSTSRPVTTTTFRPTQSPTYPVKSHKTGGKKSSGGKPKKSQKSSASKRPPHADEDTSYDYAYYDSDTLSESPQEYPEYEIPEFTKTRKN